MRTDQLSKFDTRSVPYEWYINRGFEEDCKTQIIKSCQQEKTKRVDNDKNVLYKKKIFGAMYRLLTEYKT